MLLVNQQYGFFAINSNVGIPKSRWSAKEPTAPEARLQHHQRLHWKFFLVFLTEPTRQQLLRHRQGYFTLWLQLMQKTRLQQNQKLQHTNSDNCWSSSGTKQTREEPKRQHHRQNLTTLWLQLMQRNQNQQGPKLQRHQLQLLVEVPVEPRRLRLH